MNRIVLGMIATFVAIALFVLIVAVSREKIEPFFTAEQCAPVKVADPTGLPLLGIEDMALLPNDVMMFSAYNRSHEDVRPYGVFLASFAEITANATVPSAEYRGLVPRGRRFRPHGIAVDNGGERFAFINRYEPRRAEVIWGNFTADGFDIRSSWDAADSCRANDVAWRGGELLVTIDRGSCGLSVLDHIPGATTGRALSLGFNQVTELASDLAFANGIESLYGEIYVAETRANRIVNISTGREFRVPGGPDNLTQGPSGTIVAALHPSTIDLWLYKVGFASAAPSRVVQINPQTDEMFVLYDDPEGMQFSGATVALVHRGKLIMGSAHSEGLMVCEVPPEPDAPAAQPQ